MRDLKALDLDSDPFMVVLFGQVVRTIELESGAEGLIELAGRAQCDPAGVRACPAGIRR
jgi:hypothetical protein